MSGKFVWNAGNYYLCTVFFIVLNLRLRFRSISLRKEVDFFIFS